MKGLLSAGSQSHQRSQIMLLPWDVRALQSGRRGFGWMRWISELNFFRRAAVFKSIPHFLRGPDRSAMRLAMEEANQ